MARWEPSDDSSEADKKAWIDEPTWYAQYPAANTGAQDPSSFWTNLDLAEAHVEWLLDPKNGQQNVLSERAPHWVTVAVMYDPISKWHFASTTPRGKRWGIMKNEGERVAPKWRAAAATSMFHAEDAAYFNFESSSKAMLPYANGTVIATFGKRDAQPGDKLPNGRIALPACPGGGLVPSCQEIAKKLGVTHATWKTHNGDTMREPPPVALNPVDYPEDVSAKDWAALEQKMCEKEPPKRLAIRGREAFVPKRAGSSCRTDVYGSTPVSTFSYTETLAPTPISNDLNARAESHSKPLTPKARAESNSSPLKEQDPDAHITSMYCVCEGSRTLPLLTMDEEHAYISSSCSYESLPPDITTEIGTTKFMSERDAAPITAAPTAAPDSMITAAPSLDDRDISVHTGFDSTSTNRKQCLVCSKVGVNENSCSSIKNCIVQTGKVTLEAGTSSVHVGSLTGAALYTSVSSALNKLCPTAEPNKYTSCDGGSVKIGGVSYVEAGYLNKHGDLAVTVESSKYNQTSIRDAMIKTAAASVQNAATGKNCYEARYGVQSIRSYIPSWVPIPSMFKRSHPYEHTATWCNTVGFAGPHYYNPWWRLAPEPGATDYIDAHFAFEKGSDGDFDCGLLMGLTEALAFVAPEFAIGDIGLGEAIDVICEASESEKRRRSLSNNTLDG
ncbi:hypothetical protein GGR52DRAFT_577999 [Hypoxylon sp. FL1284]|nr:hypothetical protein GGR52DRAFT_577999 [Hypoxylon sp. FL1284]